MKRERLVFSAAAITLILFGSVTWLLTMVKSGRIYSFGMGFWGPHGHDGVWHIALANSLARQRFEMPVFAGENIKNYHIGYDLFLGWLSRTFLVSVGDLYFRVLPIVLSLILGVLVYFFVLTWVKSKVQAVLSLFFLYFGGNFGWLVSLLRDGEIGGESMFWSSQAISTLINPPYAASLVFVFFGLYLLLKLQEKSNLGTAVLIIVAFSTLMQVKVYAGLLALAGLLVAGIYSFVLRNRMDVFVIFVLTAIFSYLLSFPLNSGSTSLIVFEPFWFLETLMASSDRFGWPRLYQAMLAYRSGGLFLKAILAYSVAFVIFFIGNLGTRIIGLTKVASWAKDFRKIGLVDVFMITVIVSGVVVPMLFLQKGTSWNTIQFFYYSQVFIGTLAAVSLGNWLKNIKNRKLGIGVLASVVILTVPTTYGTLRHYLPSRPPAKISHGELEALAFLSAQPEGLVLTYPYMGNSGRSDPPVPLYLYESTAYVSAYSQKDVFLEDEVNLEITGYNWRDRKLHTLYFFQEWSKGSLGTFLRDNNISYIYIAKELMGQKPSNTQGLTNIFENDQVVIYKVI